ncbi:hypothetical protein B0H14DRAFT_3590606 [Mycena olivaceomarginata]|nr:hypothetical protein B0H14DRAFT_3590606 [Mycena olivaceomarginata]
MSSAGDSTLTCFPNAHFKPEDVTVLESGDVLIDISHSPSPSPSEYAAHNDDDDNDYIPPPVEEKPHTLANVLKLALSLTHHSVLVSNFAALLSGSERDGSYARPGAVCMHLPNGKYAIRPHFRQLYTTRLRNCAALIAAALSDIPTNHDFNPSNFPVTAPLHHEFNTYDEVESHVEDFLHALRFGIAIFAKIIATTMRMGAACVSNPGTAILMGKDEFLQLAPTPIANGVEAWFDAMLTSDAYKSCADNACARIYSAVPFSLFIIVSYGDEVGIIPRAPSRFDRHDETMRVCIHATELPQRLAQWGY